MTTLSGSGRGTQALPPPPPPLLLLLSLAQQQQVGFECSFRHHGKERTLPGAVTSSQRHDGSSSSSNDKRPATGSHATPLDAAICYAKFAEIDAANRAQARTALLPPPQLLFLLFRGTWTSWQARVDREAARARDAARDAALQKARLERQQVSANYAAYSPRNPPRCGPCAQAAAAAAASEVEEGGGGVVGPAWGRDPDERYDASLVGRRVRSLFEVGAVVVAAAAAAAAAIFLVATAHPVVIQQYGCGPRAATVHNKENNSSISSDSFSTWQAHATSDGGWYEGIIVEYRPAMTRHKQGKFLVRPPL